MPQLTMSTNKKGLLAGLFVLTILFFTLRVKTIGHLLMWDEAWNILSLRAFILGAVNDPFYWFYRFHPPLYMSFASFLFPLSPGIDIRLEWLSLAFSYGTFLTIYFFSAKIGGRRYAWLSGFFLCVMPCAIGYDTWIKRDCLASFLGYFALLLLSNRQIFLSGVMLSLSLLSKENGIFFAFAASSMLFLENRKLFIKKITFLAALVIAISSWWYIFFSRMTTHGVSFFFTKTDYSALWTAPFSYYIKKLYYDAGILILPFLMIGFVYVLFNVFAKRHYKWAPPLLVLLWTYLPISLLFRLKTPWLFFPAIPALAMTAGAGALFILRKVKKRKLLLTCILTAVFSSALPGAFFSYDAYHIKTYPNGWPGATASRLLASYLNTHMTENDNLMITSFAYWNMPLCPIFLYYWEQHPIMIIKGDEKATDVVEKIRDKKISWLVITWSPEEKDNFGTLTNDIIDRLGAKPVVVGWAYVWKTDFLWKDKLS